MTQIIQTNTPQITKTRKPRTTFGVEQKPDYAKLMLNEGYSNKQIMEISGACSSAVIRWKRQYLSELNGQTPELAKALTPEQQEIQSLNKQLWRARRDNETLKKATALFAAHNH